MIKYYTALMVLAVACHVKSPQAPTWETELNLPLIAKTYTMRELAEDETNLFVDSSDVLTYTTKHPIPRTPIGDRLAIGPFQESASVPLGDFPVPVAGVQTVSFALHNIHPMAGALDGQVVPVPPFEIQPVSKVMPEFQTFRSISVKSGAIEVAIQNRLVVSLGTPLHVKLMNVADGGLIGQTTFTEKIMPGGIARRSMVVANINLSNQLSVEISGASEGTEGQARHIDINSSFTVVVTPLNLVASEATLSLPEIAFTREGQIAISDSILIRDAVVKNGIIEYAARNDFEVEVDANLEFPNIQTEDQIPFSQNLRLAPGELIQRTIALNDLRFSSNSQDVLRSLKAAWHVKLITGQAGFVTLRSEDALVTEIHVSRIAFTSVLGRLNRIPVKIATLQDLDIPSVLDSVELAASFVQGTLSHNFGFVLNSDLTIGARSFSGNIASVPLRERLSHASQGQTRTEVINLPNVAALFNTYPSELFTRGEVLVGEGQRLSLVSEFDYFEGTLDIFVPLQLRLGPQMVNSEIEEVTIDKDEREIIRDHALSGRIELDVINRLPVGAFVEILASNDSTSIFSAPMLSVGPLEVPQPEIDTATGGAAAPLQRHEIVELSKQDLRVFEKSPLFLGLTVRWPGTAGDFAIVRGGDDLRIDAFSVFRILADIDNLSN